MTLPSSNLHTRAGCDGLTKRTKKRFWASNLHTRAGCDRVGIAVGSISIASNLHTRAGCDCGISAEGREGALLQPAHARGLRLVLQH